MCQPPLRVLVALGSVSGSGDHHRLYSIHGRPRFIELVGPAQWHRHCTGTRTCTNIGLVPKPTPTATRLHCQPQASALGSERYTPPAGSTPSWGRKEGRGEQHSEMSPSVLPHHAYCAPSWAWSAPHPSHATLTGGTLPMPTPHSVCSPENKRYLTQKQRAREASHPSLRSLSRAALQHARVLQGGHTWRNFLIARLLPLFMSLRGDARGFPAAKHFNNSKRSWHPKHRNPGGCRH